MLYANHRHLTCVLFLLTTEKIQAGAQLKDIPSDT